MIEETVIAAGQTDWWSTLDERDRSIAHNAYLRAEMDNHGFLKRDGLTFALLATAAYTISEEGERPTGVRMAEKALSLAKDGSSRTELHYAYNVLQDLLHKDEGDVQRKIDLAIEHIERATVLKDGLIAENPEIMLLPSHAGYSYLTAIYEKLERYKDALIMARDARIYGWLGDWDRTIDRLRQY